MTDKNQSEVLDFIAKYPSDLFVAQLEELSRGQLARLDEKDVTRLVEEAKKQFAKELGITP